jgi:hypothetical protein
MDHRGSRKHILDWTSLPEFPIELLRLVQPVRAVLTAESVWMPRGRSAPEEARLETFGPRGIPQHPSWDRLRQWWLKHTRGANTPNWDLAVRCDIDGRPSLILVEAKANVPEMSDAKKPLPPDASVQSVENHEQIAAAIREACEALRAIDPHVAITCESHYQLANRVAFTWKLASLGIPTVLVYLGFTGDSGIRDAGEPFADAAAWQHAFANYCAGVVPPEMFERPLAIGDTRAWLLVRSLPVREASPSRRTPAEP